MGKTELRKEEKKIIDRKSSVLCNLCDLPSRKFVKKKKNKQKMTDKIVEYHLFSVAFISEEKENK